MSEYNPPPPLLDHNNNSSTNNNSTTSNNPNDPQLLIGLPDENGWISTPRDSDVLCGRGGAALRHPGNQTYRRLVNLNKGLYITCLKTEKLKISRSIVAAIREQNGRFLEKNATDDKWYDIGDKKAVEKTSQALREGQPKLRQKIVELGTTGVSGGGMAATTPQYGENNEILINGIHHPQQSHSANHHNHSFNSNTTNAILQQQQKLLLMNTSSAVNSATDEIMSSSPSMLQILGNANISSLSMNSHNNNNTNGSTNDFNTEYLLRRLSLHDLNQSGNIASLKVNHLNPNGNMSNNSMMENGSSANNINNTSTTSTFQAQQQILQQQQQLLQQQQQILFNQQQQQQQRRASGTTLPLSTTRASVARELGMAESQLSVRSDFSFYGGGSNRSTGSGGGGGGGGSGGHNIGGSFAHHTGNSSHNLMNDSMLSMLFNGSNMNMGSSNNDLQQQLMNMESFRNSSLMGLPISSFHMDPQQQQQQQPLNLGVPVGDGMSQQQQQQNPYGNNMNVNINTTNNTILQQLQLQQQQQQQVLQQQQMQQQQQQQQQYAPALPTQQQKRQLSSSSVTASGGTAGNNGTAGSSSKKEKQNFDRRRVFAGMKYMREPSVPHNVGTGTSTTQMPTAVAVNMTGGDSTGGHHHYTEQQQQQQQQPPSATPPSISINTINTIGTITTMGTDVEGNLGMEASTMSFFSDSQDNNAEIGTAGASGMPQQQQQYHHQQQQLQPTTNNSNYNPALSVDQQLYMLQKQQEQLFDATKNVSSGNSNVHHHPAPSRSNPPGSITLNTGYGTTVVVETARVVDKSSSRLNANSGHKNNDFDAMSIGSRMSMMSGLSRISDGNENDSIFSDLSKKIGNVSTRSMAMSEMSALEIQELNDEDDADDQQEEEDDNKERQHDNTSSATLNIDDGL